MPLSGSKFRLAIKRPVLLTALFLLFCGIVLITLFTSLLLPRYQGWQQLADKTSQYETELEQLQSVPIPDRTESEQNGSWREQVPPREEFYRFLLDLHEIETSAKVVVDNILFGEEQRLRSLSVGSSEEEGAAIYEQSVTMSLEGTYSEMTQFLGLLLQLERIVNISKWSMTVAAPPAMPMDGSVEADPMWRDEQPDGSSEGPPSEERFHLDVTCSLYYTEQLAAVE